MRLVLLPFGDGPEDVAYALFVNIRPKKKKKSSVAPNFASPSPPVQRKRKREVLESGEGSEHAVSQPNEPRAKEGEEVIIQSEGREQLSDKESDGGGGDEAIDEGYEAQEEGGDGNDDDNDEEEEGGSGENKREEKINEDEDEDEDGKEQAEEKLPQEQEAKDVMMKAPEGEGQDGASSSQLTIAPDLVSPRPPRTPRVRPPQQQLVLGLSGDLLVCSSK